jgi:hypothetical protein
MGETCRKHGVVTPYKILVGTAEGKRPLGRPDIDLRIILKCILKKRGGEILDWIRLAEDGFRCQAAVNTAKKEILEFQKRRRFDYLIDCQLLKKDCALWS